MERFKTNFKYWLVLVLFFGVVLVWYAVFAENREGLLVAFLDVGQGDAIFIQAPNGNQVLLDGGENKEVLRKLSGVMPFYDRSLDLIIESHPDSDHIGGLIDVLKRYKVSLVMEPGVESESVVYKELSKLIREKDIEKVLARRGMRVNLDEGFYIYIMFPDRDVSRLDSNYASIMAKLVYGETSFLLTGDSPKAIETHLVSLEENNLESDVLKVAHHGSKTSTSEMFLGYVSPGYAIISAGEDNKYGHPHKEVLDILNQFEVTVLRTDQLGTIKIKSDGENITIAD